MKKKYVLRDVDESEIERLRFQHEVWKASTQLAMTQAELSKGDRVVDLGCGAGYLSFDLAQAVGDTGKVYAIDTSEKFLAFIEQQQINNIQTISRDIRNTFSDIAAIRDSDKIFCRWVLMFTGELEKIVTDCYQSLREGGKFISIEYFNFDQIDLFPSSPSFKLVYENVQKLLRLNGGNPNVGNQLHEHLLSAGFKKINTFPIYRTGHPDSALWNWLEKTSLNHRNLVDVNLISEEELNLYYEEWQERSAHEYAFVSAPPLMIIIAEK